MKLIIGNKNYSSWSMRPWILLKQFEINFEEVKLRLDCSDFYKTLEMISPVSKVPLLIDDNGFVVWDSLAIIEFVAEHFPNLNIWPKNALDRARARSLCAEMHSGFSSLRKICPMNIDADFSLIGAELLNKEPGLAKDLARFEEISTDRKNNGPFLFGEFCAVDAYYAPVVMRITRYGLKVSPECKKYLDTICNLSSVCLWVADAIQEKDFLKDDEPYRKNLDDIPSIMHAK